MTDIERDRLRAEGRRLQARGEAIQQLSRWSDTVEPWHAICDALLADPENAAITLADDALPDEPIEIRPPPPPVFIMPPDEITDARTGEKMTMAEYGRRRLVEMRPKLDPTAEAMAIEAAIVRSRKLAG